MKESSTWSLAKKWLPTPIPRDSAGARGQHRCADGLIGEQAEAHLDSESP